MIRKQYDEFEALPGLNVRGDQTLGENIADLGGVLAAFDAYHASLGGAPAPVIDGFTGDQRFFMSWAQAWANHRTPDALTSYVRTNNHSPPMFRVNGVVRNIDSWYEAFDVKPNDRLFLLLDQRARLW